MHPPRNGVARILLGALMWTLALAACAPGPESPPGEEAPETGAGEHPVVYGNDDRTDVYAHADTLLRERARRSTVALMSPSSINTRDPDNVTFSGGTLGSAEGLCSDQRFRDDPAPAWCSGTLIDDDLVLTAGHCVVDAGECADTRFVFNFYRTSATALQPITTQDIFSCRSIVVRREATSGGRTLDYAIIKLDRSAAPRFEPAPIRPGNTPLAVSAGIAVIGSGSGIPFKIDSGGKVRDGRAGTLDYFVANTDTFGGNSGSGVYDLESHTVAGILVRGTKDYVARGGCFVVNTCAETACDGEDINYVRPAIDAFCQASTSTRLCGSGPPPTGGASFTFTAAHTASATSNTVNKSVTLAAGQKITLGTCGVTGSALTGDSFLRLFGPTGVQVAANDDGCGGRGSHLSFTATVAGPYEIRAGCYSAESCSGTVAWTLTSTGPAPSRGSLEFSASDTNHAMANTVNQDLPLTEGQSLSFGTCTEAGASGTGDTVLRLFNGAGQQVTSSDDACGLLSYASYTVPPGAGGTYQLRAGCYDASSCGGVVTWTIR
ncbi:hypothetical protein MYSTI_06975 [Myxococcus stipitatus DSM 14675]|uniref:Serine protease n=1 Tax=Myxococcus stipitatus (strain DSM 14675 / JCM 12634 / Mx s8) TaxID=1278073 RepID=L7UL35_MYXSD|nr:serine protease [Myxococcus stipitatus]AGC48247.1 hypothetical protein MYSTI_06975 [Myxococcus stipitatus DSM 14675]